MIKLEHVVEPSPDQMMFVIEGMRNPMNSWKKSDSYVEPENIGDFGEEYVSIFMLGPNDKNLMKKLAMAGTDHRKFMRMMPVMVRITAPLYWWKEFDTYKVGTVANSCSTMHKITEEEFTVKDFSTEHLFGNYNTDTPKNEEDTNCYIHSNVLTNLIDFDDEILLPYNVLEKNIKMLNRARELYLKTKDKKYWWQLIQLLPSSYNQTRNVMLNYEVLYNMYHARKNHKLDEWREFCRRITRMPSTGSVDDEESIYSRYNRFDMV